MTKEYRWSRIIPKGITITGTPLQPKQVNQSAYSNTAIRTIETIFEFPFLAREIHSQSVKFASF